MQAMTRGGVLSLQTAEGADGVWVTISDTGGGIAHPDLCAGKFGDVEGVQRMAELEEHVIGGVD